MFDIGNAKAGFKKNTSEINCNFQVYKRTKRSKTIISIRTYWIGDWVFVIGYQPTRIRRALMI